MNKWAFPLECNGKQGAVYKAAFTMSITPSSTLSADSILGSVRWTNSDYGLVLTSFGFQIATSTGLSAVGLIGIKAVKLTSYTAEDSGGTDISSSASVKVMTGMSDISGLSLQVVSSATAGMTAGTRTVGNILYQTTAYASTQAGISQTGTIYDLSTGDNDPIVLLENEGIEYRNSLDFTAAKNLQVNVIASFKTVPVEILKDHYGLS